MLKIPRIDIRSVKRMLQEGKSVPEIAKHYGVSRQAIYQKIKAEEFKRATNMDKAQKLGMVRGIGQGEHRLIDPETGLVVENRGVTAEIIGRMGDERVTAFVQYHMDMMVMRQGVDKRDVNDLRVRFYNYLSYCAEHGIVPNNMNAYFAIGVTKDDISKWRMGKSGTPEHKEFAELVTGFFASVHEQGGTDGVLNPISAMFWQKAHDGLIEASKLEVTQDNPLGDKKSAEELSRLYDSLPD